MDALTLPLASLTLPGHDERLLGLWLPFGLLGVIAWAVWVTRRVLTSYYAPTESDHRDPVRVVAPAFREAPLVLEQAVATWLRGGADEVILVLPEDEPANVARAHA